MRRRLVVLSLCCTIAIPLLAQQTQDDEKPNFPTDDEVRLVTEQSDRAFSIYERSLDLEAELPSVKSGKIFMEKDRQVLEQGKLIVAKLKTDSKSFHGLLVLILLVTLDDASRNAALCSGTSMADQSLSIHDKHGEIEAYKLLQVSQSCLDASTQLYTVSENVHQLLVRDMTSNDLLTQQEDKALKNCASMLNPARKEK
jgi:hypothetical protein